MQGRAGVFVSLKKGGELRGCIGTIFPVTGSTGEEVIENAVSAATRDPRFPPVTESELPDIQYSVDVLSEPEDVADTGQLDPIRYGVIVSDGLRRGLLLPDLEGVDTVEEQIRIASMKAGLAPGDPNVSIQRFEVKRYR
jgi:AmmeMemoRadiSam system protein A